MEKEANQLVFGHSLSHQRIASCFVNHAIATGSKLNFLFTLKFDAEGNSKIVKTRQMSDPESDESNQ
jgi:hypothetical protein